MASWLQNLLNVRNQVCWFSLSLPPWVASLLRYLIPDLPWKYDLEQSILSWESWDLDKKKTWNPEPVSRGLALKYHCLRRRQWHPTPVLLPGKSHGWRSLVGCSPWGHWESDMTEQLHFHFSLSCIGEGSGSPLQCSCLENPRGGRVWWAAVCGIAQSRTRLKRLSSSSNVLEYGEKVTQLGEGFGYRLAIKYKKKKYCCLSGWIICESSD